MYLRLKTHGFHLEVPFNHGACAKSSNGQGIRPAVNVGLSVSRSLVATAGSAAAANQQLQHRVLFGIQEKMIFATQLG